MRYRVATGGPKTGSEALRRPRTALSTQRHPGVALRVRAARAGLSVVPSRLLAALRWPGTGRDVVWSSTPLFGRAVSGWCRLGFYA